MQKHLSLGIVMAIVIPILLALLSMGGVARAGVRPVVVYSPHGPEMLKLATDEFKKVYPAFAVDWQYMGADEALTRLLREKDNPVADVWWGGPQFMFIRAGKAGLLSQWVPEAAGDLASHYKDENSFWIADLQTPLTIVHKQNGLSGTQVLTDWDDLLHPSLARSLVLRLPKSSGTMRALIAALIDRQVGAGRTLEQALAWMKKLEAQVARYVGHSEEMFGMIGQGRFPVGMWNISEILQRSTQGYPVVPVFPRSGMPVLLDCVALTARKHENPATRKFAEFVVSREFQDLLAKPPFNRIVTRTSMARSQPAFLQDKRYREMDVDWNRIAEHEERWFSAWESGVLDQSKLVAH